MAKGKSKSMSNNTGPNPGVTVYTGAIRQRQGGTPTDATVVRMASATGISGSTTGIQSYVSTGGVTSCSDWSSYAAVYDEVRVLGFEVEYLPNYIAGNSTVVHSLGFVTTTHSASNPGPYTNVNVMIGASDYKRVNTASGFVVPWKMASTEEAQFVSTGSAGSNVQGWINWFWPNATSTSQYGLIVVTFCVQFRGRK